MVALVGFKRRLVGCWSGEFSKPDHEKVNEKGDL